MKTKMLIDDILKNIDDVIAQETEIGRNLWKEVLCMHPADAAQLYTFLEKNQMNKLFEMFPKEQQLEVFDELSVQYKEDVLDVVDFARKTYLIRNTNIDELTDLFDEMSEDELKESLGVLSKNDREKVLSLLKFEAESAGGIMSVDIVTIVQDVNVARAIQYLQKIKPNVELHRQIYVTDRQNKLVGYIDLEDLVFHSPSRKLSEIIKEVPYIAQVEEDQEEVSSQMVHYGLMTVPVVDDKKSLMGVISEETLIDVIQQEATEDAQRMSGAPITESYFDTSFFSLLYKRGFILALLLLLESVTSIIIGHYEAVLTPFLVTFFAILFSTGGNTSGQASAIAIQGMSSGDINSSNILKFIRREFLLGSALAIFLSAVAFGRIYSVHSGNLVGSFVVSLALGIIVLLSVLLGSMLPIILKKLKIDPAFSAGPLLATLMDIVGLLIYCYVAYLILG